MEKYCKQQLAPKTLDSYKHHLEKRIIPAIGHIDIKKLKPIDIISFINALTEKRSRFDGKNKALSDQSILYCYRVLSSMLQTAVHWQILYNNPCARVKPPKASRSKNAAFTMEQTQLLLTNLKNEKIKYQAIIMLALATGLRLGKLIGLQWPDIDFDNCCLHVLRSNQTTTDGKIISKNPKNETSVLKVTIPSLALDILREYRENQSRKAQLLLNKWHKSNWVFTTWDGKPMYPSTPSQWFQKFFKKYDLPKIPFHSRRHTSATLLIAQNMPLKNISSRLGHADIRTTGNIYAHALDSIDRKVAETMNDILTGKVDEN